MNKLYFLFLIIFFQYSLLPSRSTADSQTSHRIVPVKSFKGWELYSWREKESNIWNFSLFQGTNRNRTEKEIKSTENTRNIDSLKDELKKIEANESVFWQLNGAEGFTYPNETIVEEILSIGKDNGFNIIK